MRDAVDGGGLRQDMDEDDCHEGESDDNQHKRVGYYQVRRQHSYCYCCCYWSWWTWRCCWRWWCERAHVVVNVMLVCVQDFAKALGLGWNDMVNFNLYCTKVRSKPSHPMTTTISAASSTPSHIAALPAGPYTSGSPLPTICLRLAVVSV